MTFTWIHYAIILFFISGVLFAVGPFILSMLIAPKTRSPELAMPYECGMEPYGSAWVKFGINYYFYALLFLAFDVDVLYLFPVATYYAEAQGPVPFIKLLIFIVILFASVLYFWKKGVFTWPKRIRF
ncbi:MAG: NADH-quinone oxidoreductase subunit A [Desulfonatronovibrionaceae bacterium]